MNWQQRFAHRLFGWNYAALVERGGAHEIFRVKTDDLGQPFCQIYRLRGVWLMPNGEVENGVYMVGWYPLTWDGAVPDAKPAETVEGQIARRWEKLTK